MPPDPDTLTPGVLDGAARAAFCHGACAALAIAIVEATGWDLVAVTDHHNVTDGHAGGGSALHWMAAHPNGGLVDVDGLHTIDDIIAEHSPHADDGQAAIGTSTIADALDWYVDAQGEPVPLELAATFVEPVLAQLR